MLSDLISGPSGWWPPPPPAHKRRQQQQQQQNKLRLSQSTAATRSLINKLTLTIALVALFASFAIGASSSVWRQNLQQQQQQEPSSDGLRTRQLLGRLANLNERVVLNDFNENVVNDESEADDEEFLRHLKLAAHYLDEQMAREQHKQQLQQAAGQLEFGNNYNGQSNLLINSVEPNAFERQQQQPLYGLLSEQQTEPIVDSSNERFRYALPLPLQEPLQPQQSPQHLVAYDNDNVDANSIVGAQPNDNNDDDDETTNLKTNNLLNYLTLLDRAHDMNNGPQHQLSQSVDQASNQDQNQNQQLAVSDKMVVEKSKRFQKENDGARPQPKMTTLLEEDEDDELSGEQVSTNAPSTATSNVAYGKVIKMEEVGKGNDQQQPTGMLDRMYANLSYYLPFLNQINLLRHNGNQAVEMKANKTTQLEGEKVNNDKNIDDDDEEKSQRLQPAKQSVSANKTIEQREKTKQNIIKEKAKNFAGNQVSEQEVADEANDKSRRLGVKVKVVSSQQADGTKSSHNNDDNDDDDDQEMAPQSLKGKQLSERENSNEIEDESSSNNNLQEFDEDQAHRKLAKVHVNSASKRLNLALTHNGNDVDDDDDELEHELDQMIAAEQQQQQQQATAGGGFNLIRQSNLVLPLQTSDSLLVRTTSGQQVPAQDSLLGKYIYAPTQHYYLNAAIPTTTTSGHLNGIKQQQHQAYEHLRPAYAYQKDQQAAIAAGGSNGGGVFSGFANLFDPTIALGGGGGAGSTSGKPSNDLYFLVMVGAFCMMAMAVVLAAGLFAYRAQQQRKLSQTTDYPTYGVVGPNNMMTGAANHHVGALGGAAGAPGSGKCGGAAAFVGGYFNSPLVAAQGKANSAKHLADLYGSSASAAATIDSGLADRSSSTSASSSGVMIKKSSTSTISSGATRDNNVAFASNSSNNNNNNNGNANDGQSIASGNQDAARMYHYQHQKQQMIISDRSSAGRHTSASDLDSDEENDDGSYTVYECPGLASAHEMEIKNPLFNDDQSP